MFFIIIMNMQLGRVESVVSALCGLLGRVENVVWAYYEMDERGKRVVRT